MIPNRDLFTLVIYALSRPKLSFDAFRAERQLVKRGKLYKENEILDLENLTSLRLKNYTEISKIEFNESEGYGLFAKKDLSENDVIAQYPIILIPSKLKKIKLLTKDLGIIDIISGYHTVGFSEDLDIFSGSAVLTNHSCDPNAVCKNLQLRNGMILSMDIVAIKPIETGQEITVDYDMFEYIGGDSFQCECKMPNCRNRQRGFKYLPRKIQWEYLSNITPQTAAEFYKDNLSKDEMNRIIFEYVSNLNDLEKLIFYYSIFFK